MEEEYTFSFMSSVVSIANRDRFVCQVVNLTGSHRKNVVIQLSLCSSNALLQCGTCTNFLRLDCFVGVEICKEF